jgi:hypothetical protein
MAFKRSAVRSRVAPPNIIFKGWLKLVDPFLIWKIIKKANFRISGGMTHV